MTDFIQSALTLGDEVLTSSTPIYFKGEIVKKVYLGNLLVYSPKRAKRFNNEQNNKINL